ncbi:UDP-N-acetylenolpyruvoylglucosamine reductase [Indibacter alkaliphilus LW1]|uniref:UDP-N-acetylenolpyruvoylglucosamine reductase n=1 Tax=Indibacter alkaliphilus (strain CCUG 57479 / KCTC 22604 / LW1) TaxID=1189612 RepID=S2D3X9_INDAL|nr:UDP-N-acetylmuramate dehydrogenase [Indibacter alkaliphilus]EOZ93589.1 UDP-N-acetylenolpyruvoylglucosamine reductase [Indibacter alkaliphilus LW1]
MQLQENISLLPYNTFGIDKKAKYFVQVTDESEVKEAIKVAQDLSIPLIVLGGGSNILLTQDLKALLVKIEIKGVKLLKEDEDHVWVEVGAGENWHSFVMHCIEKNWSGVENLSLIPGTVGASPMQNIGAYGIEIKEVFESLSAVNRHTLETEIFDWESCEFGYRESVFKGKLKDKYIITKVCFKLSKNPIFHTDYGAIKQTLNENGIQELSIKAISDAVIQIRQSKLPDPKQIGNAGSFFKNPTISLSDYEILKKEFPEIPGYPNDEGIKIPAAWLIEQTGWKGKTFENIGVHKNQPLVLVNYGGGDGNALKKLSEEIQESVKKKFGILLFPEVNFL